jgi:hypothetical protein
MDYKIFAKINVSIKVCQQPESRCLFSLAAFKQVQDTALQFKLLHNNGECSNCAVLWNCYTATLTITSGARSPRQWKARASVLYARVFILFSAFACVGEKRKSRMQQQGVCGFAPFAAQSALLFRTLQKLYVRTLYDQLMYALRAVKFNGRCCCVLAARR